MKGGRIIGEGADGCVVVDPLWPCASESKPPLSPSPRNTHLVSKLVLESDKEPLYLKAASRILGPLAKTFIAGLEGECRPANSTHPPSPENTLAYGQTIHNIHRSVTKKDYPCNLIKKQSKTKKGIADTHRLLYVRRYPMNVAEWIDVKQPLRQRISNIRNGIGPFLNGIQKFYQSSEQLIHIDLHIGNLFIRPPSQIGIADFGHSLL